MTLDELRELVTGTQTHDWHELSSGPVFFDGFGQGSENGEWRLFTDSHHGRAVLKANLDVGLAWGLTWRERFEEPWTQNFADTSATGHYADVLWRGSPVIRELYVTVDGGRYAIPLPGQQFEEVTPSKHVLLGLLISPWEYALGKLIHGLSASHDYDEGLRRARVEMAEQPPEGGT
jgi:hypothetical protein